MEWHDSLPYIDADVTQAERDAAHRLIQRELSRDSKTQLHPSLQPLPHPQFSDFIQKEIERHAKGQPREGGVDISRYEAPDEPSSSDNASARRDALKKAYVSSTYLSGRRTNLALLEEFGKNSWLIGNSEVESISKTLETEAAQLKMQSEEVNKTRKTAQESSRGELQALEDTWKRGVGKTIEVQVATANLQEELSLQRRSAAR